ncbi:MAG: hypothetical protein KGI06_05840 [Candidatus Micrarchaeota archaeon]|nr:hypothetical protein [Candidatus Micrarchaeota archaeon]
MSLPRGIQFNPNPVKQGQRTQLFSSGFLPGEPIIYSWPALGFSQQLQADINGNVSASIIIDANRVPGDYTIDLQGVTSKLGSTSVLTVISSTPELPPILTVTTPPPQQVQPPQPQPSPVSNPLLLPFQNIIDAAKQDIESVIRDMIVGIDWFSNTVSPVETYIQQILSNAEQSIISSIGPLVNQIDATIGGITTVIKNDVEGQISLLQSSISDTIASIQSELATQVINPVINIITALPGEIETSVGRTLSDVGTRIDTIESGLQTDIQTIRNDIINSENTAVSQINLAWSNVGNGIGELYSSFNSFQQEVTSGFTSFAKGLDSIASGLITELENMISADTAAIINSISNTYNNEIKKFVMVSSQFLTVKSSDDPQTALSNLIQEISGITIAITGTFALLSAIENVHPFHSLHLSETFKHILEFVGVYDLSRETLKLFVDNGIGLQAEYAVNNLFQARKLGYQEYTKGLWYGSATMDQVLQEAQYEGYEKSSRDVIAATRYKAMPPFILEKLIELQMVSNDFATQQLLKDGFSPSDTAELQIAFGNLELQSFQGNIKTLIYSMYKDGFTNDTSARAIMTVFAIPSSQQDWILKSAQQEYLYETQLLYSTQIIDAYKKGVLDANTAEGDLILLGMTPTRAKQKLAIAAVTDLPSLSKTERQSFYNDLAALGVTTS